MRYHTVWIFLNCYFGDILVPSWLPGHSSIAFDLDHSSTSLALRVAQRAANARLFKPAMEQQTSGVQSSWWQRLRWRHTSPNEAQVDERSLLALAETPLEAKDVAFGPGPHDYLHTVTGGHQNTSSPQLVYVPGYGAGSAFLFKAMQGIAAGFRMFAVDPLGTGLSGRPKFTARSTAEAEAFFVNSMEKWREAAGVDQMVLVGHSMGGYISACYALRHPERVKHLIMVCPAGVGRRPDDWVPPASLQSPWTVRGQLFRLAVAAWESGITPGGIIRTLGPYGKRLVEGYTRRRFQSRGHHFTEEEVVAFQAYMYHVLAAPGSGEFALNKILEPFAYPRAPLEDRMDELKVPVTFVYGQYDWMDPKAAARVCNSLEKEESRGAAGNGGKLAEKDRQIIYTPNAGHYPFIDQPGSFLLNILEACEEYLPAAAIAKMKEAAERHPFRPEFSAANDTKAQMDAEMESNPAAAETRVATDM